MEGKTTHSSTLAWKTTCIKGPGGHSPWGHRESDTTECTCIRSDYLINESFSVVRDAATAVSHTDICPASQLMVLALT